MPVELQWLAWSVVLGLVYIVVAASFGTWMRGLFWNLGNRDSEPKGLGIYGARAHRASRNFMETFALFAAATLAVIVAQRSSAHTLLAAQLYFWARVVYLPIYILGIPYLRTLVWAVSIVGIGLMLGALLY